MGYFWNSSSMLV